MRRALFEHYSQVPPSWMDVAPNFSFEGDSKMVSRDTGAFFYVEGTLLKAQAMREYLGQPLYVNSWYRSPLLNAMTPGAAPLSQHQYGLAIDFSTRGKDRQAMYQAALRAGWTSYGFYASPNNRNQFLHVGTSGKRWFGSAYAKKVWMPILNDTQLPEKPYGIA